MGLSYLFLSQYALGADININTNINILKEEMEIAEILAKKARKTANQVDDYSHIGTAMNDVNAQEHACYSLGMLVGQSHSVQHIRLDRKPILKASNSDEAYDLRVTAQSLDNFIHNGKRILKLNQNERIQEWNLDCVGHLGINGQYIQIQNEQTFYKITNNGTVLQVLGGIEKGFASRIKEAIIKNPRINTVALGSGGGYVNEAIEAGHFIRSRGIDTTLWSNCFSACPLVFIGGVNRIIWRPHPYLGFHKIYDEGGNAVSSSSKIYNEIKKYINEMGVSSEFMIKAMLSAEPSQMLIIEGYLDIICENNIATWTQYGCVSASHNSTTNKRRRLN